MIKRISVYSSLAVLLMSPVDAETLKEDIDSGTRDYRLVKYTDDDLLTCVAFVCERRNAQRCGTEDGMLAVTKRTAEDFAYVSYYPAEREASRKLKTSIQVSTFLERSFYPIEDYPETWIVPAQNANEDMIDEMDRAVRSGPFEITVKTESFPRKIITVRDFRGMEQDVLRMCPHN